MLLLRPLFLSCTLQPHHQQQKLFCTARNLYVCRNIIRAYEHDAWTCYTHRRMCDRGTVTTSSVFFLFVIYCRIVRRYSSILAHLAADESEKQKFIPYAIKKKLHTASLSEQASAPAITIKPKKLAAKRKTRKLRIARGFHSSRERSLWFSVLGAFLRWLCIFGVCFVHMIHSDSE